MYGGLLIITSYLSFIFFKISLFLKFISTSFISALYFAIFSIFFDISVAVTVASGNNFFNVIAIAPEPVPMSIIFIFSPRFFFINSTVFSTKISVSGLGINTFLST